jgi:polyisoprenoid-binding protein YceI
VKRQSCISVRRCVTGTLTLVCVLLASSAQANPRKLTLDPSSSLIVQTWKDGPAARLAHDHAIAARQFSGEGEWAPGDPTTLQFTATVQVASLDMDAPDARSRVGLTGTVPAADTKASDQVMKGENQLDAKRFPTITFRSTRVVKAENGALTLEGRFTLHGQTRVVRMPMSFIEHPDGGVEGSAAFTLKVSDFGITPYSAFLGAMRVKDEVTIHLALRGTP